MKNTSGFVKIIPLKSDNYALTLRKRRFCTPKAALLPCKTAAFRMQNNMFCNTLINNRLNKRHRCEKYLHLYSLLSD
ncbi:hypothetical protein D2S45_04300 [Prevotella intermedia]|uniref:Uncharacterized protein n=1 Tax=Prevotella intermedia TaxID=28131 RepID=A0A3R8G6Y2_PREIN|nr:hypothetical protein D2S53_04065 [Prevotella intermedia]RRF87849.1 hypothetical protein D2S45_04300 [Prevotella intermedia]